MSHGKNLSNEIMLLIMHLFTRLKYTVDPCTLRTSNYHC